MHYVLHNTITTNTQITKYCYIDEFSLDNITGVGISHVFNIKHVPNVYITYIHIQYTIINNREYVSIK